MSWTMRLMMSGRALRAVEFCAVFGGIPLIILALRRPGMLALVLWGGGLIAWWATRRPEAVPLRPREFPLWFVLLRFIVLGGLLTVIVWQAMPGHFLDLPRRKPVLWVAIMLLYPALSVWPQEIIYRRFLFQRYAAVLPTSRLRITASAAAFGFAHIIFLNVWAVLLTCAGGILFAQTYARSGTLRAPSIEHALYGCLIFTIGLGQFFYTGAAWH